MMRMDPVPLPEATDESQELLDQQQEAVSAGIFTVNQTGGREEGKCSSAKRPEPKFKRNIYILKTLRKVNV